MENEVMNIKGFGTYIEERMTDYVSMFPDVILPVKWKRAWITAAVNKPEILGCTQLSLSNALNKSAELGLEPGFMGLCYLIPYGKELQCQIGYRGHIELCRRTDELLDIQGFVVYEKDKFDIDYGAEEFTHKPYLDGNPGEIKGVWARAKLTKGRVHIEYMRKDEIDAIRKLSKTGNKGPWVDHYGEMAKKTVLKRMLKMLPINIEDYRHIKEDEIQEFYRDVKVHSNPALPVAIEDGKTSYRKTKEGEDKK